MNDSKADFPFYNPAFYIVRNGQEILISYYAGFESNDDLDEIQYTMPVNPYRVLSRAAETATKYGFKKIDKKQYDYLYDDFTFKFTFIVKVADNLAKKYDEGLKNMQLLLEDATRHIEKEVFNKLKTKK